MRIQWSPGAVSKVAALLFIAAVLVIPEGCARSNNAGNTGNGMQAQRYSDDGYLGITNSYPHVPGRHMALNYQSDAAMMRDAIRDIRGVGKTDIAFHGAEAYVTIHLQPGIGERDAPTVESQAAAVLRFNFPRYTIHVRALR